MNINIDPNILVSIINMKLRNDYKTLYELCDDLDISQVELEEKLKLINYIYVEESNQFKNL